MKQSILLVLLLGLSISCSNTRKSTNNNEQKPPDQIEEVVEEETEGLEEYAATGIHYAVRFLFTKTNMKFQTGSKQTGVLPLLIAPAFDAFTVTYDGNQLLSFYAFPNPLEASARQEAVTQAEETLLLPSFLATTKNVANVHVGVYEIAAYIDNWEERIRTKKQLEQSIKDGFLKELYELDVKEVQTALQQIN